MKNLDNHTRDQLLIEIENLRKRNSELEKSNMNLFSNKKEFTIDELTHLKDKFHSLFNAFPIPTYAWQRKDNDFILINYNESAKDITKGGVIRYIGSMASEMYKDDTHILDDLAKCFHEKSTLIKEMNYQLKSTGETKLLIIKYVYVPNDLVMVHTEDITDQNQTREALIESETRFEALSEATFEAIFISEKGICLEQNNAAQRMFGYSLSEAIGKMGTDWIIPEDREKVMNNMMSGYEKPYEVTAIRKNGSTFPAEIKGKMMLYKGRNVRVTALQDISERKRAEDSSKKANYELQQSKNQLELIIDKIPGFIAYANNKEEYIHVNQAYADFYQIPKENFTGKRIKDLLPDKTYNLAKEKINSALKGQQSDFENIYINTDGDEIILWAEYIPHINPNGKVIAILASIHDISEQKKSERNLITAKKEVEKSEQKFRDLFDKSGDAILIIENRKFVDCNQSTIKMLEYDSKTEMLNVHPSKLSPEFQPDGKGSFKKANEMMDMAIKKGKHRFEWNHMKSNGKVFPVEVLLTSISTDKNNEIIHTVWRDITTEKKTQLDIILAKEKAEENEEKFKAFTNQAIEGISVADLEGNYTYVNPSFCEMVGWTEKELLEMTEFDVTADKQDKATFKKTKTAKEGVPVEVVLIRKDRTEFVAEVTGKVLIYNGEKSVLGSIRDITDRKQSELELRKLSTAVEQSANTIVITDIEGNIEYTNPKFTQLTGYSANEALGLNPRILNAGTQPKTLYTELWETISKGVNWKGEFHNKTKNGDLFWENVTITPIKNDKEEITNYMAIKEDITEQKKSQEEIIKSENLLRESQKIANIGSYKMDIQTGLWESSAILDQIFGINSKYNRDLKGWIEIVHPDDKIGMQEYFTNNILSNHELFNKEYKIIKINDSEIRWLHGLGKLEFDKNGNPTKMIGTIQDITERKLVEDELTTHREHLEEMVKERTKDLEDKNAELARYNELFIGREFRIKELRDKVKELEKRSSGSTTSTGSATGL